MDTILDFIPGVMGLPAINAQLEGLLKAMAEKPATAGLEILVVWAKIIGLCIALGVGANECFQMMLGRRGLDVMKLLHIVIISICITFAGSIADMAASPGRALGAIAYSKAEVMNNKVKEQEETVAKLQEEYLKKMREHMQQLEENRRAEDAAKQGNVFEKMMSFLNDINETIKTQIKEMTLLAETKICEWINLVIRFLGEVLFQVSYYGILVCQAIFMNILAAFAPLMFAISLSPHYKSAWSQWLSKYISVSLWSFVTYIILYYVDYIMSFNLDTDIASYNSLMKDIASDTEGNWNIGAIGMQAVGTTCMYVVGLLVGVRAIAFVPEVASWLIPGGVSSGAGASSAAMGTAAAAAAPGLAATGAGAVVKYGGMEISQVNRDLNTLGERYNSFIDTRNSIKNIPSGSTIK